MQICHHLGEAQAVPAPPHSCPECVALGSSWVHLRQCLVCGHVGCCDSSPHRHATAHYRHTEHPIMRSVEPGEHWGWCFVDELQFDADKLPPAEQARG